MPNLSLPPTDLALKDLLLDPHNPRLPPDPEDLDRTSQDEIALYMETAYRLEEIAESIVARGFDATEALWVVPTEGSYTVVEGNRRLAALRFLTEPDLRKQLQKVGRRALWDGLSERLSANGHEVSPLPVVARDSREEFLDHLGFRHVSGVLKWTAEAKARYLTELVERDKLSYADAAKRIGSNGPAVRRQVEAYRVLRQAKAAGMHADPAQRWFGFFYTAFARPGFRKFLGVEDMGESPADAPVPPANLPHLEESLGWLFGTADGKRRVVTDSRQISDLVLVIEEPHAADVLRRTRSLPDAVAASKSGRRQMLDALRAARESLYTANGRAFEYRGDADVMDLAKSVSDLAVRITQELAPRPPGSRP